MKNLRDWLLGNVWARVALAASLTGAVGISEAQAENATSKDAKAASLADANSWTQYGHDQQNTRFSPLKEINTQNVGKLKLAYAFSLGSLRSNEATPIVVGDTLYVSSSWGPKYVYALDAKSGKIKWKYEPDIPDDVLQYACCDVNSRGVTYADGKIFVGTLNGKLIALDASTGAEDWIADVVDYKQGSVITSPPLVVRNLVITGFGGGEYGARGSLQAYDVNTGKEVWKTYTVSATDADGTTSWKGDSWQHGGGVGWLVGSYDPKTDTVFWGTSNPSPWATKVRSTGNGDYGPLTNLYTASTLAIDPATGKIKWHVQGTPADAWDYDGVNELVLADLKTASGALPAYMKADRNGFFYVVNRETGKLVSAEKFVPVNWASKIDLATARPVEDPDKRPGPGHPAKDICPHLIGAKNWQPMSYSPDTGLVYIPSNNVCQDMSEGEVNYRKGVFYLGKEFSAVPGPGGFLGKILAWDPVKQKAAWEIKEELPFNGGTLATGGGLVFYGTITGDFKAVDAKTGAELWKIGVGSGVGAGPISFSVDGKQYIAVVAGRTVSTAAFFGDIGTKITNATPEGGTLFVFSE
ncbi:PQQ-dependent dehydrogenase (methanol/ethanol family) [Methylocella tundrae]|uniref:PQQ-dependent dehydrogenase (Methanol/ethanol family) n=1 Tax=Methylocella tundrae TaxID=227605 RepID=A0A8B6M1E4_METTU|nr:PQQ-dependent dehydrogenase, methanol/ethanol family [Methylocella tundrae]VTZ48193.1 PQQ-dependent dehydrogenase (methanol/ethanol family) [Methylocella tundrae]